MIVLDDDSDVDNTFADLDEDEFERLDPRPSKLPHTTLMASTELEFPQKGDNILGETRLFSQAASGSSPLAITSAPTTSSTQAQPFKMPPALTDTITFFRRPNGWPNTMTIPGLEASSGKTTPNDFGQHSSSAGYSSSRLDSSPSRSTLNGGNSRSYFPQVTHLILKRQAPISSLDRYSAGDEQPSLSQASSSSSSTTLVGSSSQSPRASQTFTSYTQSPTPPHPSRRRQPPPEQRRQVCPKNIPRDHDLKALMRGFQWHLQGLTEKIIERDSDEMDVDKSASPSKGEQKQSEGKGKGKGGKGTKGKGKGAAPTGIKANTVKANEKRPAQIADAAKKHHMRRR